MRNCNLLPTKERLTMALLLLVVCWTASAFPHCGSGRVGVNGNGRNKAWRIIPCNRNPPNGLHVSSTTSYYTYINQKSSSRVALQIAKIDSVQTFADAADEEKKRKVPRPGSYPYQQRQSRSRRIRPNYHADKNYVNNKHNNNNNKSPIRARYRMSKTPEQVEAELERALEALQQTWTRHKASLASSSDTNCIENNNNNNNRTNAIHMILFPTVRECNAALALFGDAGELLRALRMFKAMRKAAALQQLFNESRDQYSSSNNLQWNNIPVPAPTMVTYSTLMSRANKQSKPQVALRLWNLMDLNQMEIDIKAANIRMNCFAKLADPRRAENLLKQMKTGSGPDVPFLLKPNLVTYNTLIDACHRAGDLDAALAALDDMRTQQSIRPDARTYTSLIATVARKPSLVAGRNDPTLAFTLLEEMKDCGIRPNGMTYSALIDACGRCRRSDLALQGLRIMLRQKAQEEKDLGVRSREDYVLPNEVGAWTAAINACGRSERLETAIRLFYAMPSFGVLPNTVTCGSLMDSLLRAGRTAETLNVLRYMKKNAIEPSEVMYTSLMTRAEHLVRIENRRQYQQPIDPVEEDEYISGKAKAIEVYTELIQSLTDGELSSATAKRNTKTPTEVRDSLVLKVFLVFQEMKAVGAQPDLACYNALLRACARAGDFQHAQDVLQQIQEADLTPNDVSWRQLIQAAAEMKRSDLAEVAWNQGLSYRNRRRFVDEPRQRWKPSVRSIAALTKAYLREAGAAAKERQGAKQEVLYQKVVDFYEDILMADKERGLDQVDIDDVLSNQQTMLLFVQAMVALEAIVTDDARKRELRTSAASILKLDCFKGDKTTTTRLHWAAKEALEKAKCWL